MVINPIITPSLTIAADVNDVCFGKPVVFIATTVNEGSTPGYQWEVNENIVGTNSDTYTSSTLNNNDVVSCVLVSSIICTSPVVSANNITMHIYPLPVVQMGPDQIIPLGTGTILSTTITGNINSYVWQPAGSLNNAGIQNPVATPSVTTTYLLNVTTTDGCKGSGEVTVKVYTKLYMPNAFTPNQDGKDDIFRIPPAIATTFDITYFSVYDRWGNKIFSTADSMQGWDGTYQGQLVDQGNYVWFIQYTDAITGKAIVEKGSVLLLR